MLEKQHCEAFFDVWRPTMTRPSRDRVLLYHRQGCRVRVKPISRTRAARRVCVVVSDYFVCGEFLDVSSMRRLLLESNRDLTAPQRQTQIVAGFSRRSAQSDLRAEGSGRRVRRGGASNWVTAVFSFFEDPMKNYIAWDQSSYHHIMIPSYTKLTFLGYHGFIDFGCLSFKPFVFLAKALHFTPAVLSSWESAFFKRLL